MSQHKYGAATTRRKRAEAASERPEQPTIYCSFGCGKAAQGGLSVYFAWWNKREERSILASSRDGMSVMLPACWECARGSIKLTVSLPKEPAE